MYNGGGSSRQNWQNANNPNMAPLPVRPRPGVGVPQMQPGMQGGNGMIMGGPPPQMGAILTGPPPMMNGMPGASSPSSAGGVVAHTTLFVGNISAGVTDQWLHNLLNVSEEIKGSVCVQLPDNSSIPDSCTTISHVVLFALSSESMPPLDLPSMQIQTPFCVR
jgi:hypothetical protein